MVVRSPGRFNRYGVKSVSQFIATQNSECVATRQNCIANCDAIPLISNAGCSCDRYGTDNICGFAELDSYIFVELSCGSFKLFCTLWNEICGFFELKVHLKYYVDISCRWLARPIVEQTLTIISQLLSWSPTILLATLDITIFSFIPATHSNMQFITISNLFCGFWCADEICKLRVPSCDCIADFWSVFQLNIYIQYSIQLFRIKSQQAIQDFR